jgi:hypothetical protein
VSISEIWQIVERDLEPLRQAITAILPLLDELKKEIASEEEPGDG